MTSPSSSSATWSSFLPHSGGTACQGVLRATEGIRGPGNPCGYLGRCGWCGHLGMGRHKGQAQQDRQLRPSACGRGFGRRVCTAQMEGGGNGPCSQVSAVPRPSGRTRCGLGAFCPRGKHTTSTELYGHAIVSLECGRGSSYWPELAPSDPWQESPIALRPTEWIRRSVARICGHGEWASTADAQSSNRG